ncbi:MAG: succinate dehydrogenase, hydrophobic membrane anchor protein [Gammaproteobacteria bacterium]
MSLRSPLARVLGLGAAGDGPAHWWSQRVSAVALALLAGWFLISALGLELGNQAAVSTWLAEPLHTVLMILLTGVLAYHSAIGFQVVIEDYTAGWVRIAGLLVVQFLHFLLAAIAIVAILRVAFGVR